jgi:Fe2+ or Zn2+ uptake regulation protein
VPPSAPADLLRAAGLRITAPRVATLRQLARRSHVSVDDISAAVRDELGAVSTQAIYDALRAFTAAGIVRRIEPAGSPARYELRVGDNHHHLVCRVCGAVDDVDCAVGAAPCLEPSEDRGFAVEVAEVVFWGICPHCQAADLRPAAPPH